MSDSKFKPLKFFFLAANALLATGLLCRPEQELAQWAFLIWSTFTGIFLTYRFNDFIDADKDLNFDWKQFMTNKYHKIVIFQFIFILAPFSLYYLSSFQLSVLFIIGFLGFLYSLKINIAGKSIRLKHIFLVKNFLIGTCWGALVLVGVNELNHQLAYALFIFASFQVFIGSSIRDLTDIDQDTKEYVHSLPVVLGFDNTLITLHFLNIMSVFVLIQMGGNLAIITGVITFIWRTMVLLQLKFSKNINFWSQRMNLLTCFVIFIGQLMTWILLK